MTVQIRLVVHKHIFRKSKQDKSFLSRIEYGSYFKQTTTNYQLKQKMEKKLKIKKNILLF